MDFKVVARQGCEGCVGLGSIYRLPRQDNVRRMNLHGLHAEIRLGSTVVQIPGPREPQGQLRQYPPGPWNPSLDELLFRSNGSEPWNVPLSLRLAACPIRTGPIKLFTERRCCRLVSEPPRSSLREPARQTWRSVKSPQQETILTGWRILLGNQA